MTPNAKGGFDIQVGEQRRGRIVLRVPSTPVADAGRQTGSCPTTSPRFHHPAVPRTDPRRSQGAPGPAVVTWSSCEWPTISQFSCTNKAALAFVSLALRDHGLWPRGHPAPCLLAARRLCRRATPAPAGSERSKLWQWRSYRRERKRKMCVHIKEGKS